MMFVEISELNANSIDPDQTPRSAASDLDLHCLPVSLLRNAWLKWGNFYMRLRRHIQTYTVFQFSGFLIKLKESCRLTLKLLYADQWIL